MAKLKIKRFSKVQAVKATARAVVGTPPPKRILPDPKRKRAKTRRSDTLAQLLTPEFHEGDPR